MNQDKTSGETSDTQERSPIASSSKDKETKKNEERNESTTKTNNTEQNPSKPSWIRGFILKHFPESKPHDRWNLASTAVIAASTCLYTFFAGWTLVEIRSNSSDTHTLADAAKTQADVARAQAEPNLHLSEDYIGFYHLEENKGILVHIAVQNDGKTNAEGIFIASRLEFRDSAPVESELKFGDGEFKRMADTLAPFDISAKQPLGWYKLTSKPIAQADYPILGGRNTGFYVWGEIRSKDVWKNSVTPRTFCGHVTAKQILDTPPGDPDELHRLGTKGGYTPRYIDVECSQAK